MCYSKQLADWTCMCSSVGHPSSSSLSELLAASPAPLDKYHPRQEILHISSGQPWLICNQLCHSLFVTFLIVSFVMSAEGPDCSVVQWLPQILNLTFCPESAFSSCAAVAFQAQIFDFLQHRGDFERRMFANCWVMFLDSGRKPENLEQTFWSTIKTWKLHTERLNTVVSFWFTPLIWEWDKLILLYLDLLNIMFDIYYYTNTIKLCL